MEHKACQGIGGARDAIRTFDCESSWHAAAPAQSEIFHKGVRASRTAYTRKRTAAWREINATEIFLLFMMHFFCMFKEQEPCGVSAMRKAIEKIKQTKRRSSPVIPSNPPCPLPPGPSSSAAVAVSCGGRNMSFPRSLRWYATAKRWASSRTYQEDRRWR